MLLNTRIRFAPLNDTSRYTTACGWQPLVLNHMNDFSFKLPRTSEHTNWDSLDTAPMLLLLDWTQLAQKEIQGEASDCFCTDLVFIISRGMYANRSYF